MQHAYCIRKELATLTKVTALLLLYYWDQHPDRKNLRKQEFTLALAENIHNVLV